MVLVCVPSEMNEITKQEDFLVGDTEITDVAGIFEIHVHTEQAKDDPEDQKFNIKKSHNIQSIP